MNAGVARALDERPTDETREALASAVFTDPPSRPAGHSGRPYLHGHRPPEYEHNRAISNDRQRALKYERMMRECAALHVGYGLMCDLLMTAGLSVRVGESTSEEAADLLARNFGLDKHEGGGVCRKSSDDIIRTMSTGLLFGSVVLAEDWEQRDGAYHLADLHYRWPGSLQWWFSDEHERLTAIQQSPTAWTGSSADLVMPIDSVLYAARWPEMGGYQGVGMLRPCVGPYDTDRDAALQVDVTVQRYGTPSPVAKMDPELAERYFGGDEDAVLRERNRMDITLREYLGHEHARMVLAPWWSLDYYGGSRIFDPGPINSVRLAAQREMLMVFGAQFLTVGGEGSSGSFSAIQVQADTASRAIRNHLDWMLSALNGQSVRRLLDANFGAALKREERPRLEYTGIGTKAFADVLDKLRALYGVALTPQAADEDALRAALDLPPLEDATRAAATPQVRQAGARVGRRRDRTVRERATAADIVEGVDQ
jgi:hypothetical protein